MWYEAIARSSAPEAPARDVEVANRAVERRAGSKRSSTFARSRSEPVDALGLARPQRAPGLDRQRAGCARGPPASRAGWPVEATIWASPDASPGSLPAITSGRPALSRKTIASSRSGSTSDARGRRLDLVAKARHPLARSRSRPPGLFANTTCDGPAAAARPRTPRGGRPRRRTAPLGAVAAERRRRDRAEVARTPTSASRDSPSASRDHAPRSRAAPGSSRRAHRVTRCAQSPRSPVLQAGLRPVRFTRAHRGAVPGGRHAGRPLRELLHQGLAAPAAGSGCGSATRSTSAPAPSRPGSLWFTLFDAEARRADCREGTFPADRAIGRRRRLHPDRRRGARAGARTRARSRSEGLEASWDLSFADDSEPLRHLPYGWMYRAPLPRTKFLSPYPDARYSGRLEVGGREIELDGWPGMIGHNWGAEHAERWTWVQGAGFARRRHLLRHRRAGGSGSARGRRRGSPTGCSR